MTPSRQFQTLVEQFWTFFCSRGRIFHPGFSGKDAQRNFMQNAVILAPKSLIWSLFRPKNIWSTEGNHFANDRPMTVLIAYLSLAKLMLIVDQMFLGRKKLHMRDIWQKNIALCMKLRCTSFPPNPGWKTDLWNYKDVLNGSTRVKIVNKDQN